MHIVVLNEDAALDFMRLLKSIEELLYELVTWILFYPLTLYRSIVRPVRTMTYAVTELTDPDSEQYEDALSPPIYLLLTLLLTHLFAVVFSPPTNVALPSILTQEPNELVFRAAMFSVFPLALALLDLRQRGIKLTRKALQPAFYSQCYSAAPFIASFNLGVVFLQHGNVAAKVTATVLIVAGFAWYIPVQTAWLAARSNIPRGRALLLVIATIAGACLALAVVVVLAALAVLSGTLD